MIKSVHIKNFKSVVDLKLDLGRFNVFIGENGCGKSNILEALAFGAAASADKLDFEFLGSRGIRVTNPEFMFSAFAEKGNRKNKNRIEVAVQDDLMSYTYNYHIANTNNADKKWRTLDDIEVFIDLTKKIITLKSGEQVLHTKTYTDKSGLEEISNFIRQRNNCQELSSFIIYSPEQSSLRKFEDTTQIYPLGIKGEGIFQYLKELSKHKKNSKLLKSIKDNLILLDWFENFELPANLLSNEFSLNIRDRYLNKDLQYFDQRSTNEGFLYLLFYSTLFISPATPTFFAVDNIDTSFNPKLCKELTKNLATLAKKHKKQAIVTTHNPAILDGLNLKDDEQRLFVIRRNDDGHTIAERIKYNPERTMKLSEIWTNGYIGGLPDNF